MDFSKYDPLKKQKAADPETGFTAADYDDHRQAPESHPPWMESSAVIRLIEYLGKYPDQGATLHTRGAESIWISFRPGVKAADLANGRGQVANNMINLLQEAAPDLRAMIVQGVEIPLVIKHEPKAKVQ